MQDLNDYYYFARIAQLGSLTAASEALGIPKSTLSRHISQFEERLGVRLLQRTSRRLGLTEIGEVLFQQCASLVSDLEAVEGIVSEVLGEPQGNINFSCSINIACTILPGLLADFQNRHPRVSITVQATNNQLDLIQEGVTISLRALAEPLDDSFLVARFVGSPKLTLVASPEYLRSHERPQCPQDLHHHDLLYSAYQHQMGWALQNSQGEKESVIKQPKLLSDTGMFLLEAAVAGLGIALTSWRICMDEIAAGTLEYVLLDWTVDPFDYYLIYPSRRGMTLAARIFIEYLMERLPVLLSIETIQERSERMPEYHRHVPNQRGMR